MPQNGVDDDKNGYVDDVTGYDFANEGASVYDPDPVRKGKGDEHGTHVAGTIAAEGNNGIGVTGVNWQAGIMVLKFLGPNGGYTSDAVEALNYAFNNGAQTVDLGAPGVSILSTLPGDRYGWYSGTSMATPHVTGAAALIKSRRPELDDAQLKAQILRYVDKLPSLEGKTVSGGRLNLVRALTQDADVTEPVVAPVRPKPDSRTRDRTPSIIATVRDEPTGLTKNDIRLYLDGVARGAFTYTAGTDRLSYTSGKLSYARHTVKVVARDAAGNVAVQAWRFEVVR